MKKLNILFLFIFCLSFISSNSVVFHLGEENVLVDYNLEEVYDLEIELPSNVKALDVNVDYSFENNVLKIDKSRDVEIEYISDYYIEKTSKGFYFVFSFPFNISEVEVYLPEGAKLSENKLIFPEGQKISSDGYNIILEWNNFNKDEILISYEFVKENNSLLYFVLIVLILGILFLFPKNIKKIFRKKRKNEIKKDKEKIETKDELKDLTKNLFEDEKRIVRYLYNKKDNESWTKEIIRDLGISKVKLSRKLRSLEQKEVIKRIPYGNENRIRLLKK